MASSCRKTRAPLCCHSSRWVSEDAQRCAHTPCQAQGPHPLTAPHIAAAEPATEPGVDEGPLACVCLQVCVIGQALLSLLSTGGSGKITDLRLPIYHSTIADQARTRSSLSEQERGRTIFLPSQPENRGQRGRRIGLSERGGVRKLQASLTQGMPSSPTNPPLPFLAQVDQFGHIVAQLGLHHLAGGICVPVPREDKRQKTVIEKENAPGKRDPTHSGLQGKGHKEITLLSVSAETSFQPEI